MFSSGLAAYLAYRACTETINWITKQYNKYNK